MSDKYQEFLTRKAFVHIPTGIASKIRIHKNLFKFQADVTRWALRRGRAGLFESTGLGKTIQQLEFAKHVENYTRKPVLVITPLAVAQQTEGEALRHLNLETRIISGDQEVSDRGIYIINYQKIHRIDPEKFSGVVLDEASILKGFDRATASRLIEMFEKTEFKLVCTATPAPNDFGEIGAYSEFLGVMTMSEMLSTFFVHDGGETQSWRLKGHAEQDFWRWLASWSAWLEKPSDIGYEDDGYILPSLHTHEHVVKSNYIQEGELIAMPASTLKERRDARRGSINERVEMTASLVGKTGGQWCIWCNLNDESAALTKAINGAVEVKGGGSDEHKEKSMLDFAAGKIAVLVTKPSIAGHGMNWQCCHQTAFVGLSDSWEQYYQAVRRFYRYGQKEEVHVHVVISEAEGAVLSNIKRKDRDAARMRHSLVSHMSDFTRKEITQVSRTTLKYTPDQIIQIPDWLLANSERQ